MRPVFQCTIFAVSTEVVGAHFHYESNIGKCRSTLTLRPTPPFDCSQIEAVSKLLPVTCRIVVVAERLQLVGPSGLSHPVVLVSNVNELRR